MEDARQRRPRRIRPGKSYLLSSPARSAGGSDEAGASREEQSPANSSTLITDVGAVRFSALLSRRTGGARGHRRSGSAARDARCICGCNGSSVAHPRRERVPLFRASRKPEANARASSSRDLRHVTRSAKERCSFPDELSRMETLHSRDPRSVSSGVLIINLRRAIFRGRYN